MSVIQLSEARGSDSGRGTDQVLHRFVARERARLGMTCRVGDGPLRESDYLAFLRWHRVLALAMTDAYARAVWRNTDRAVLDVLRSLGADQAMRVDLLTNDIRRVAGRSNDRPRNAAEVAELGSDTPIRVPDSCVASGGVIVLQKVLDAWTFGAARGWADRFAADVDLMADQLSYLYFYGYDDGRLAGLCRQGISRFSWRTGDVLDGTARVSHWLTWVLRAWPLTRRSITTDLARRTEIRLSTA